jgi:hypothetical protein
MASAILRKPAPAQTGNGFSNKSAFGDAAYFSIISDDARQLGSMPAKTSNIEIVGGVA